MEAHKHSIVKAIRYIEEHLDTELSLEKVSGAGAYSPFHFHRIFRLITGETLQNYVARRRAEKGAFYLAMRKEMSITDIYHQSGFSNHSAFNKAFKKYYGISPSGFRKAAPESFHRIVLEESKKGQMDAVFSQYICNVENLLNWMNMNLKIKVGHLPEMHLAAVMSLGVAHVEPSFGTLIDWAKGKSLFPREQVKMLSVYHDSFKVTPPDKVRIHACMLLDEPLRKQEGEVFPETIEAGKFIIGSGEVTLDDFEQCWVSLFLWMNENEYSVRNAFPFEIYHTNFREHPEGKMIVDFCIPIH
ncbi:MULTISPECIES: AraC family transcriptional regulator [Chryseobacterium]|uniref:AraC family transcriptional regulator n=1 Tax=Chryseobacterium camelliae TaxID=1265445 RepID=A0ABU0TMA9_9FLAO|nr:MULTISPECIES: helix-turn-helix domain-containing protein [Chryseobacterium]MDT3407958.1 AraC family transcriptional regulator [Pseudacidovorax intermedius]MDQ1098183.1 AraC family transcriptional regulator [Chryseobacterium camelliae]MDQ1102113.1 AraC family transcriptional regulator [Chryseobacterium sp. SORGH_AS_1048]MDR6085551.1 AraC family transcriptional regulator [Chryseobacterium sp. SORGH_AS_0909]MDR6129913.1 AraC family transcriptional regulator [Chryseobacterium sp. SORGH_AS_1175]